MPPHTVPIISRFDYIAVDRARNRVYAAHTGSQALLVVDGSTGKALGQVDVGPMHGVAVDPADGTVYTGDGTNQTVSKVDPVAMTVVATSSVGGNVDGIAYDPQLHRIYADEDGVGRVFVVDARTMKTIATIRLPGNDPESLVIDHVTHRVYQNLNDTNSIAVIDAHSLAVIKTIKTSALVHNHPLVFDAQLNELIVGGKNGVMSAYSADGRHIGDGAVQADIDQCSIGERGDVEACAGKGVVTLIVLAKNAAPRVIAHFTTGNNVHTIGIDEGRDNVWIVYAAPTGDYVQALKIRR
jgi:DNA-binding beta-propeller fold protein YncE